MEKNFKKFVENLGENSFFTPEMRHDLYQASKRLAELIKERGFENILFLDTSARPMATGLVAYWHKAFAGKRLPGIFFVNPEGVYDDLTDEEVKDDARRRMFFMEANPETLERIAEGGAEDLLRVHRKMSADKKTPTLIVDTCIHTGETVQQVYHVLEKAGMENISIAAVSEDPESSVVANDYLLPYESRMPCLPFGPDGMVKKGDDVISERGTDPYGVAYGKKNRKDIKEIIEEGFEYDRSRDEDL